MFADFCEEAASIVATFRLSMFNLRNFIESFFGGRLMVAIEMTKVGNPTAVFSDETGQSLDDRTDSLDAHSFETRAA